MQHDRIFFLRIARFPHATVGVEQAYGFIRFSDFRTGAMASKHPRCNTMRHNATYFANFAAARAIRQARTNSCVGLLDPESLPKDLLI